MRRPAIGIDFGTTNTVTALAGDDGHARLVSFAHDNEPVVAFRSALSFHAPPEDPRDRAVEAGPWAIDAYVEEPLETRFIQSFKTYAASPLFVHTNVLGRWFRFEDLLSAFLVRMRHYGGADMAEMPKRLIVGRPVTFAGRQPDPALALSRYETAFRRLGWHRLRHVQLLCTSPPRVSIRDRSRRRRIAWAGKACRRTNRRRSNGRASA